MKFCLVSTRGHGVGTKRMVRSYSSDIPRIFFGKNGPRGHGWECCEAAISPYCVTNEVLHEHFPSAYPKGGFDYVLYCDERRLRMICESFTAGVLECIIKKHEGAALICSHDARGMILGGLPDRNIVRWKTEMKDYFGGVNRSTWIPKLDVFVMDLRHRPIQVTMQAIDKAMGSFNIQGPLVTTPILFPMMHCIARSPYFESPPVTFGWNSMSGIKVVVPVHEKFRKLGHKFRQRFQEDKRDDDLKLRLVRDIIPSLGNGGCCVDANAGLGDVSFLIACMLRLRRVAPVLYSIESDPANAAFVEELAIMNGFSSEQWVVIQHNLLDQKDGLADSISSAMKKRGAPLRSRMRLMRLNLGGRDAEVITAMETYLKGCKPLLIVRQSRDRQHKAVLERIGYSLKGGVLKQNEVYEYK